MASIIKITDLRKVYRVGDEKVVALDKIDLEIEQGIVCCILGTSGSGKSTLLNQLAGLEKPTRGEVVVAGKRISKMTEKELAVFRQQNIGFVFQSYNLLPGMTALENVALPLTFRGIGRRERNRRAKKMLEQVGLSGRASHTPHEMSGGQQQRVGIARAFVANPSVVFADEPTGNLDTKTTREVMHLFLDFSRNKGTTIVLVTHDQALARYADRIITIVDGNVVSDEPNDSLYEKEIAEGVYTPPQAEAESLFYPPFPERDNGFSCGKPSGQELSSGSPQDVPDGPLLAERGADFRDGVAEGAGPELSQETEESAAFLSQ